MIVAILIGVAIVALIVFLVRDVDRQNRREQEMHDWYDNHKDR